MQFNEVYKYTKELSLLYVEDEADVRETTTALLRNYFDKVYVAKNGEEGLLLYEESLQTKVFDIVITDINMPRLSGVEMAKKMKTFHEEQVVIFVSAHHEKDFLLEAIKLGVNYYIIKPIDLAELSNVLYKVAQNISNKISVQKQTEDEQKKILKNERYKKALEDWSQIDLKESAFSLKEATELSAKTLDVARVSIWIFDEYKDKLVCQDLYSLKDDTHTSGMSLEKQLYPNYFQTINTSKIVVIDDARNDPRSSEFTSTYLEAHDIYSMLEIPLVQDSELLGVICYEVTAFLHHWDMDEQKFCMSIANNLSLSLEIKKRNEIQEMLDYQAHHDQLTKLPNRTLFLDRLHQAIKQNKRNETKMALLFIDLDNFKQINDSLGHDAGDKVLQAIAQRLQGRIRESDTLARLGGDEFTLILSHIVDDDTIIDIVENILQVTQKVIEIQTQQLYVTLSIGISIYPNDGESVEDLLKYADAAMYKSKESGKNTYHYYTQEMTQKAVKRVQMETELRRAIENEEFIVYYQAQYDARYDTIIGMEALVRWIHPTKGLISPLDFIPIAEEIGVIVDIDRYVMKLAMQQVKSWHQSGVYRGKLALNLSTVMLQSDTFLPSLQNFIKSIDFDTSRLELEITEGHIMKDPEKSIQKLQEIAALGISIAIDDFGTGYSSLSYLKKFPVHKLKIDKSFVDGIPFDKDDCAITKTIIGLSENLKLGVIAEGVETLEQRDFLLQNGCVNIQGYYYCKPLSAHDMQQKLSEILIK
ncbi:MAG TPA: hypothetical protein CFH84_02395 [Sulfurimonas sp. UBA12504]|nr:MAG TPA: hypothetical protein CFH84_02395 [Sulfurimonas sp. UBA12504]